MKEGDDRMRGMRKIKRMVDIGFTVCKRAGIPPCMGLERGHSPLLKERVTRYISTCSS